MISVSLLPPCAEGSNILISLIRLPSKIGIVVRLILPSFGGPSWGDPSSQVSFVRCFMLWILTSRRKSLAFLLGYDRCLESTPLRAQFYPCHPTCPIAHTTTRLGRISLPGFQMLAFLWMLHLVRLFFRLKFVTIFIFTTLLQLILRWRSYCHPTTAWCG